MSHPNVLPLYGIYKLGDTRNRIALIFPWIPNGTVNEFLRTKPDADRGVLVYLLSSLGLSDPEVFLQVAGVAAGMSYLHKNQVVHGDIRGASILVSDSGRACLTDFGLASIAEAHGVQHPGFSSSGIVRFQAPELIDPDFDCPRSKPSDVYAFAMSSYQIYTGHRPFFELERDYGVLIKVSRGERPEKPLDPFCKDRGLTDFIWELIQECWEQIPSKRPSAAQIVERLSREFSRNLLEQDDWKDLSPARFRQGHSYSDQIKNTMIEETLCLLQTTRVFVS
ncbi:hypothetical protein C0989_007708 [Termitomyces sp. Mn162]|nr:hypothetical protein C0989_007708 [Termitomyces sp. Mn162]